jgi:hypothetical protein
VKGAKTARESVRSLCHATDQAHVFVDRRREVALTAAVSKPITLDIASSRPEGAILSKYCCTPR